MAAVITGVSFPADGRPVVTIKVSERHGCGVKNLSATAVSWRFALLKLAPGTPGHLPRRQRQRQRHLGQLPRRQRSHVGLQRDRRRREPDRPRRRQLRLPLRQGDQRRRRPPPARPTRPTRPTASSSCSTRRGTRSRPSTWSRSWSPRPAPTSPDSTIRSTATPASSATPRSAPSAAAPASSASGEFHNGVRYDVRTCVACHNDQRRFTSTGTPVAEPAIAADGTWTGSAGVLNREAVLNLPVFIHKIHMGDKLTMTGGTYAGLPAALRDDLSRRTSATAPSATARPRRWPITGRRSRPAGPAAPATTTAASRRRPRPAASRTAAGRRRPTSAAAPATRRAASAGTSRAKHTPGVRSQPAQHLRRRDLGRQRQHQRRLRRGGGRRPAGRQGGDLRRRQRLDLDRRRRRQRAAAADRVQVQARRHRRRVPRSRDGERADPELRRLAERVLRVRGAAGREGGARRLQRLGQRLHQEHLERHRAPARTPPRPPPAPGAGTLTGPDASGFYTLRLTCAIDPRERDHADRRHRLHVRARVAPEPGQPGSRLHQQHAAAHADRPARLSVRRRTRRRTASRRATAAWAGSSCRRPTCRRSPPASPAGAPSSTTAKCGACHVSLGVGPDFHAGQRNDAGTCNWCHRPNQTSSAWSANQKDFVHAIHGAEKRMTPFTWHEESPTEGFWKTTYPGRAQQVRDVPPARDLRLQRERDDGRLPQHARQHRRSGDLRGRQRACALRGRGDRLRRRLQLQRADRARPSTPIRPRWWCRRSSRPAPRATTRRSRSITCRPTAARSTRRAPPPSPSRSRRSACSATAPAAIASHRRPARVPALTRVAWHVSCCSIGIG